METNARICRTFALVAALLLVATPSFAQPPIWEADFGPALASLTAQDDATASVTLSFAFPYDGVGYSTVYVGTNGCIQLGSLGTDNNIDYDHWSYFEEFYDDGAPEICPMNTDWDLNSHGTIHFHDFGDRVVFTWNEVGTNQNEEALASFQVQIEANGRIVFGYNGILDGEGEDLINDLDQGIVVGITASDGTDPLPTDLTGSPFAAGGTTYERWCFAQADTCSESGGPAARIRDGAKIKPAPTRIPRGTLLPGPINTTFDLDQANVIFGSTGSIVEIPTLGGIGLAGLALLLAVAAFLALRRRAGELR